MDQSAIIVTDEEAARLKARSAKIQQYLLYTRIGFRTLDLIAAYTNPLYVYLQLGLYALLP